MARARNSTIQSSSGKTPSYSGSKGSSASTSADITNMQKLIKSFASSVTKSSSSPNENKTKFNDFIAEHFLREAPGAGVEYSPDVKTRLMDQKEKTKKQITEMTVVLDTLQRIGSGVGSQGELVADGVWGKRTTNALKNVIAFGQALMQLQLELEATYGSTLKPEHMIALQNALDTRTAKLTTEPINRLKDAYEKFVTKFMDDPVNSSYIKGDRPFDKMTTEQNPFYLQSAKEQQLEKTILFPTTKQQQQIADKHYFDVNLPAMGPNNRIADKLQRVYVKDLKDRQSFENFLKSLGYANDPRVLANASQTVLSKIWNHIKNQSFSTAHQLDDVSILTPTQSVKPPAITPPLKK